MGYQLRPGALCWVVLAVVVILMDVWLIRTGKDTMSIVFGDAVVHPMRRWYVTAAWSIITAHLFANAFSGAIPEKAKRYDPIGLLARAVKVKKIEAEFSAKGYVSA